MGTRNFGSLQPFPDLRITGQRLDKDLETMRAYAAAIAASGIAAGLMQPAPATAQIAPHSSDKASAAYSPSAMVQTGSRRHAFCFWCGAEIAPPARSDDADDRQRRKRSVLR
jgi:hypothetical protein